MDAHNFGAFEELYNIPLIVAGPGIARGARTSARAGLHDLCPTLLELAGARPIEAPDCRSLAPVLKDPAAAEKDFTTGYAEYHGTRFGLTQRIYWEGPWKFVFNGFDYDELYNLDDDPHELRNLAAEAACRDRVRSMMTAVWRNIRDTGDRTLLNSQYYSMRFAAVGPDAVQTRETGA
jgi:choline-sulfatase